MFIVNLAQMEDQSSNMVRMFVRLTVPQVKLLIQMVHNASSVNHHVQSALELQVTVQNVQLSPTSLIISMTQLHPMH